MGITLDPVLQAVHLQALTKVTRHCSDVYTPCSSADAA
jgi:hypothetical protein